MNYQKHYNLLIARARARVLEGYVERHHILPRCMGGGDDDENIVQLTPEEHFTAHVLLLRIHKDTEYRYALAKACSKMTSGHPGRRVTRGLYGWLRREHSIAMSASQSGPGNSQFGSRWVSCITLKENKKIAKNKDIPEGWVLGRNKWKSKHQKSPTFKVSPDIILMEYLELGSWHKALKSVGLSAGDYSVVDYIISKNPTLERKKGRTKIKTNRYRGVSSVVER